MLIHGLTLGKLGKFLDCTKAKKKNDKGDINGTMATK